MNLEISTSPGIGMNIGYRGYLFFFHVSIIINISTAWIERSRKRERGLKTNRIILKELFSVNIK